LRKYLVAAVAATAAIGVGTAFAQDASQSASMKVSVGPKKAGTKKHPQNSSVGLNIKNGNPRAVLSKLDIQMPKTLAVSGKGFPACKKSALDNSTLDSKGRPNECKKSRVGGGVAKVLVGVNSPNVQSSEFKVTAVVGGKSALYFYLHGTGGFAAINTVAPGKVKNTKKGPVLTVKVPKDAQNVGPLWNGLVQLKTTLKGKKGKHLLIGTTGCKHHKQAFSTKLTFARAYDASGNRVSGYTKTVKDAAACK
jgi:hypothetical protein